MRWQADHLLTPPPRYAAVWAALAAMTAWLAWLRAEPPLAACIGLAAGLSLSGSV